MNCDHQFWRLRGVLVRLSRFCILVLPLLYMDQSVAKQACKATEPQVIMSALGATDLARYMTVEAGPCDAIVAGRDGVTVSLFPNNPRVNGGVRAELAFNFPFNEGETVRYAWRLKLPAEFHANDNPAQWWLLAQWHDQPDRRQGETWANFPPRSPPIALFVASRAAQLGIGLVLGGKERVSWTPVATGAWIPIAFTIRWSTTSAGAVRMQVGGDTPVDVTVEGPNMLNSYQHYLKIGQYRHPVITSFDSASFRDLSIQVVTE